MPLSLVSTLRTARRSISNKDYIQNFNNPPLSLNKGGLLLNKGRLFFNKRRLLCQADAVGFDGDEMAFVKVADSLFVGLLGDPEAGGNLLGR